MRRKNQEILGTKDFYGSVDITDPCYDRDVRYRLSDVKIKSGLYTCMVAHHYGDTYEFWGEMHTEDYIRLIGIYLDGVIPRVCDMEKIGDIGVDSGMAGFFHNKPDYDDKGWSDFCGNAPPGILAYFEDVGFFSQTAYGDGDYPVYAHRDSEGNIDALEIKFM